MKAHEILKEAARILEERGKLRDTEEGERSMKRAVTAYNALTGNELSEMNGWLFMCCLKMARATAGNPHLDDASDLAGYASLLGECISEVSCYGDCKLSDPNIKYTISVSDPEDSDGWIEHDLKGMPVPPDTIVDIVDRSGGCIQGKRAGDFSTLFSTLWEYDPYVGSFVGDITKYRVVSKGNPEKEDVTWIEWKGGERPVSSENIVEVKLRNGDQDRDWANFWSWIQAGAATDIVAYRVVKEEEDV